MEVTFDDQPLSPFYHDHHHIERLIKTMVRHAKSKSILNETILSIRWAFERHFYLEEKLLCASAQYQNLVSDSIIARMMQQHDELLAKIQLLEKKVNNRETSSEELIKLTKAVQNLSQAHMKYELKQVYQSIEQSKNTATWNKIEAEFKKDLRLGFYPLQKMRKCLEESREIQS